MKIGTLVRVKEAGAIHRLMDIHSGSIALDACEIEDLITPHVARHQKVIGEYVKKHAAEGKTSIMPGEKEYAAAMEYKIGLEEKEIKVNWKPISLSKDMVRNTALSGNDLRILKYAKIIIVEEPKKAPEPQKKPAVKSGTRKK